MQKGLNVLAGIAAGTASVFMLFALLIVGSGLNDDIHRADVGVVLGNKVETNGQPSDRLRARLDKAVQLFEQGMFSHIIVSGGLGAEGFDEAVVMKQYLIDQGVPALQIYLDSQGLTTALTAKNAAQIMQKNDWSSALVISQYFHVPRTRLAFQQMGLSPVYAAHADFFEIRDIYSVAREVVGYGAYLFRTSN
ncbi:MAG: YdcF family protein [Thermosynechococcaceae cyanobacterium]